MCQLVINYFHCQGISPIDNSKTKNLKVQLRPNTIVIKIKIQNPSFGDLGIIRDKKNIPRRPIYKCKVRCEKSVRMWQVCKIYKTIGTNMKRKQIKWSNERVSLYKGSIHIC